MGPASSSLYPCSCLPCNEKKKEKIQREGVGHDLIKDDIEGLYNLGHTTPLSLFFLRKP